MMKKILVAVCCAALVFGFAGCAKKLDEKTAPQLAEEGRRYFEAEKYPKAIEAYKRLKDWYPYSPHAREAQLRLADSRYHLREYEEAIFDYEQYEHLYPNDPEIPYVIYQMGLCHYERIRTIDRTQAPARNALETFERLRARFPGSKYAEKAGPMIDECLENLAGHEFYVGRFYFKSGHYEAAINRFEKVISQYPDHLEVYEKAKDYREMAEKKMAEQEAPPQRPEGFTGDYDRPFGDDSLISPEPSPEPVSRPDRY